MELRDFAPVDQTATRALIQAGLRERWGVAFDAEANPDTTDLWASYVATGGEIVVADNRGEIVGTGTLIAVAGNCGQLVRMSTHTAHRRTGIARRIVDELVQRARRRGFEQLVVTTDTPWTSAVALYRSCGFALVDQDGVETRFVLHLGCGDQPPDHTIAK